MQNLAWIFPLSLFHMVIRAANDRPLALTMNGLHANSQIVSIVTLFCLALFKALNQLWSNITSSCVWIIIPACSKDLHEYILAYKYMHTFIKILYRCSTTLQFILPWHDKRNWALSVEKEKFNWSSLCITHASIWKADDSKTFRPNSPSEWRYQRKVHH